MNENTISKEDPRNYENDVAPETELDRDDPGYIDSISITAEQKKIGLVKAVLFTAVAVLVFFIPLTISGETDILFGYIYNYFVELLGIVGLWIAAFIMMANTLASFYGKFIAKKESFFKDYYGHDTIFHPLFYLLGAFYTIVYSLHVTLADFSGPIWIVGNETGGTVIPDIVLGVLWIIIVGAFFMPFLLNYGGIDFVGSILEPLMRPIFKVPGKSAIDMIASFVTSSSMAVIITSKLYRMNVYTKREAAMISTSFSAVSVGFALLVTKTAGLGEHFLKTYFSSLLITFIVSAFMVRLPPLSKKLDVFNNGRMQTDEERTGEAQFKQDIVSRGINRAAKRAYTADNIYKEVFLSLLDGLKVVPKVLTLIAAAGISGLVIAIYTPIFQWIGYLFVPLLQLLGVPDAVEIAPSIPVGFAEMFLPVLLIADQIDVLEAGAKYFVVALSMTQIIFLSETVVVMLGTKMPVKFWELVICFFQRTLIAIPIVALFMHLLF